MQVYYPGKHNLKIDKKWYRYDSAYTNKSEAQAVAEKKKETWHVRIYKRTASHAMRGRGSYVYVVYHSIAPKKVVVGGRK